MSKESRESMIECSRPVATAELVRQGQSTSIATSRSVGVLALALASAVLLWASYFPANCGWLGWVALVPFLGLVRSTARPRRLYLAAGLCGLLAYGAALQWLRVADDRMYFTWAGLALYCALFLPAALFLLRRLDQRTRLPLVLTFPVIWTALEYFRAHFGTGFPWYFLGHTQHAFLPIIQIADLAGAYAVTFLVAAVNALVFEGLAHRSWFRTLCRLRPPADRERRFPLGEASAVLVLLAATLGYGFWRLGQEPATVGPRVALLQGNLPQRIRNDAAVEAGEGAGQVARQHYRELCDQAATQVPRPDLIVWPETSFPDGWTDLAEQLPAERIPAIWKQEVQHDRDLARVLARHWQTNLLLGANRAFLDSSGMPRSYNSALLLERDGEVTARYDKIHRVPFGEYVPLRDWLPWMNHFAPYKFDYSVSPGERLTRFTLAGYRFGVVICYEDTDPYLARQYVRSDAAEPPVDFLLNISNDGWFDGTSEHEQHLAICRFRAIECRRAIARAVNMGISAVIDGNGRIRDLPGPTWAESKKVAAVLTAALPIDERTGLYGRWGDWLPGACWLILGVCLMQSWLRPRRPDNLAMDPSPEA